MGRELAAIIAGAMMPSLDTTIVSIGIASLMEAFQVSEAAVQWVSTAYLLALAVAIPVVGWAEERFGGRRCWITGLVIFLIGSFLCAVSPGLPALVVCRVLQGFGAGVLITLLTSLPVEIARNRGITEVGGIMSTVMLPLSLGPILGPVLGGIVLSAASWHWLFLINIPVGILAILFSARWLGADADGARTEKKRRFDLPGFLFVAGAISALLLGFTAVSQGDSLTAPSVAVPLILGIVMLAVFVALPSARDPERAIVDISLFRHRSVTAASAAMFFAGGTLYAAQFLFPLFWQRTIGATALEAALMLLPQGAGALLTRTAAGRLTDAYGGRGCCDRTDGLSGGNGERGRLHHVLPGAGGRFGGGRCRFPDISPVKMNQKTSSPHRPLCGIMSAERSLYHRAYRFLRPPQKAGRIRRRQHVCEADML